MSKRVLAIVPARSGSKGLRHKNVKKVGGVPLLVRAVELAKASRRRGEIWEVVVSTDSAHYARLARNAGASVLLRPEALATDTASLIDVVLHCLDEQCEPPDLVLMLSATTPLTEVRDVRGAIGLLDNAGERSVASVCPTEIPENWFFSLDKGRLVGHRGQKVSRRQLACSSRVRINGALYIASPRWLRRFRRFIVSGKTLAWSMPKARSVDIEDTLDLAWANYLWSRKGSSDSLRLR